MLARSEKIAGVLDALPQSFEKPAVQYFDIPVRTIETRRNGECQTKKLVLGSETVYLPWYEKPLTRVVMKVYGESPMMLLTNLNLSKRGLD